ncbi:MAG: glycosyltransferase [Lachnospiraceae bacterium]|nr:glycosyltransferase [Lachnospiraceae bacterium]
MDQISVIVPVHNGASYLEECIDSILAQDYEALEVLIVNDGSTDNTAKLCDRLCGLHDCLRVITLPDLGVSVARNRGLEQARGAYVMFVDADDRLRPGVLKSLYGLLCQTDSDMAGCSFAAWGTPEEWERLRVEKEMPEALAGSDAGKVYDSDAYLKENILRGNTRCWSKLYRRELIGQVRFREGLTIGEDMLFLVELLPRMRRAVETDYPGYGYYQNPGGAMRRPFTPDYMDQIYCWEMARELIVKRDASLSAQTDAQIMVAVMLTVGKIALLFGKERRKAGEYLRVCHRKLKEFVKEKECYPYLPEGYGIKVRLFACLPGLYVWLYHYGRGHVKGTRG